MDKGPHYEAAACEAMGAHLKHFKSECFTTEGVYAFDIPYQCLQSVLKPRSRHQFGAGLKHYPLYSLSLFTMNVANQYYYHPCYQTTIAENVKSALPTRRGNFTQQKFLCIWSLW